MKVCKPNGLTQKIDLFNNVNNFYAADGLFYDMNNRANITNLW